MPTTDSFYELVSSRRGHFRMESGLHSALWLDLDSLFADAKRVRPFVSALTGALGAYRPEVVCGPLLGGALLAQSVAAGVGAEFSFAERAGTAGDGLYQARYRIPPALAKRVRGRRVAIVDDVISAGSSVRATYAELQSHGAEVVAVGALMLLGDRGAKFFAKERLPVEHVLREPFDTWDAPDCPLCARGVALETT